MKKHITDKPDVIGMRGGRGSRAYIASRIKLARVKSGLTQKQLGKLLNVSDATISSIEHGLQKVDVVQLNRLSRIFSKQLSWFYGEDIQSFASPRVPAVLLTELEELIRKQIPVYNSIDEYAEVVDTVTVIGADVGIDTLKAYKIDGLHCEPMVHDGDIIIVDTKLKPVDGDHVLVVSDEGTYIGLYNVEEGEAKVADGYNLISDFRVIGVLVQLTRKLR